MAKVKIVQMTLGVAIDAVNGLEERSEYLDDKGRVWYQVSERVSKERDVHGEHQYKTVWKQLELPDEPR